VFVFDTKKKEKKKEEAPVILDFRRNTVKLPNGEIIPRDNILSIDTTNHIIVYIDNNKEIKELKYG